jgi:esterase/lipase superfamily enzyme
VFQFASYYQMGSRANQVGANGLFATLRRALRVRQEISKTPIRLTLIGHSFGCRVVCKALRFLRKDMDNANTPPAYKAFVDNIQIRAILLQAAFKDDEFDAGGN